MGAGSSGASRHDKLMALRVEGRRVTYTDRETMLYAHSVGMGQDLRDPAEMKFVSEFAGLVAMPTLSTVVASAGLLQPSGLDFSRVLHAQQQVILHRPMPVAAELIFDAHVSAIYDKGPGRGSIIAQNVEVRDVADGKPLVTLVSTILARGDGGLGGPPSPPTPAANPIPGRAADAQVSLQTRRDQALLYRLNGDRNPLHIDAVMASKLNMPAPILHGLCTYGIACRAVLQAACGNDPTRIRSFDARFSSPVYPGETVVTSVWVDGDVVSFRCVVAERQVVVIDHGRAVLGAAA